jgi:hypothetical protein
MRSSANCFNARLSGFPLLLSILGEVRYDVLQLRVVVLCLACNGHAVQTVPHQRFDQGGRKIDELFEHRRKVAFVFHGKCRGAS